MRTDIEAEYKGCDKIGQDRYIAREVASMTGSGGIGFVIGSGTLVLMGVSVLVLIGVAVWFLSKRQN